MVYWELRGNRVVRRKKWLEVIICDISLSISFYSFFGDNTVQGYGQKICLNSAIMDIQGRNSYFSVPILQNHGKKMASFLSNYKSYPYIVFIPIFHSLTLLLHSTSHAHISLSHVQSLSLSIYLIYLSRTCICIVYCVYVTELFWLQP